MALSFEDYNWNVHALLSKAETADSLAYKQSWRFVMYVEALKEFKRRCDEHGQDVPKELNKALKLLSKLFDHPLPSVHQLVGRKLLAISKIKLPSGGLDGIGTDLEKWEVEGGEVAFEDVRNNPDLQTRLAQNIDNLIDYLEGALAACATLNTRVFLCFDRVDEAWDEVSVDTSKRVIGGLVSAADSMSAKHGEYLRPIVFLREDIFETLSINDRNKLREDCGALLSWNRDSIFQVIQARLNYFAEQAGHVAPKEFDDLFDKKEMRQRAKPSNYLLKRSMMRPRDMICFLKRTIQAAKQSQEDPFAEETTRPSPKLRAEAIYEAEPGYSEWLQKELLDEWGVQFPSIKGMFDILQNYGYTNIPHDELENNLRKLDSVEDRASALRHMAFMFDNSLIGFKVGGSTQWRFKCFYPAQGFLEADEYHVHDGLIRSLNLKEPREFQESDN